MQGIGTARQQECILLSDEIQSSKHAARTSKGTDTKFASSVMGPCSSGLARKTTATDSAADMPACTGSHYAATDLLGKPTDSHSVMA